MLWDLIQHFQISGEAESRAQETRQLANRSRALADRVGQLEQELDRTRAQLRALTELLERRFGEDLNGDGKITR
jgi:uncharacterized coiled-coil protein SlyX